MEPAKGPLTQEQCAKLVEAMMDMTPWKDKLWVRCALVTAARAIRRGRHFTGREQLDNLIKALEEPDGE